MLTQTNPHNNTLPALKRRDSRSAGYTGGSVNISKPFHFLGIPGRVFFKLDTWGKSEKVYHDGDVGRINSYPHFHCRVLSHSHKRLCTLRRKKYSLPSVFIGASLAPRAIFLRTLVAKFGRARRLRVAKGTEESHRARGPERLQHNAPKVNPSLIR